MLIKMKLNWNYRLFSYTLYLDLKIKENYWSIIVNVDRNFFSSVITNCMIIPIKTTLTIRPYFTQELKNGRPNFTASFVEGIPLVTFSSHKWYRFIPPRFGGWGWHVALFLSVILSQTLHINFEGKVIIILSPDGMFRKLLKYSGNDNSG